MIELDAEQMKIVEKKKAYVAQNIKVLGEDQVVRICVDALFDEVEIDAQLKQYETDKKYAGMEDYEWNTAMTR